MPDNDMPSGADGLDRLIDCEQAIDPAFQELVLQAVRAGWSEDQVCQAIKSLAENQLLLLRGTDDPVNSKC